MYSPSTPPSSTWSRSRWELALIALILGLTLFTRLYRLDERVMAHDEVNHVVPAYDLSQGRGYVHNPITHGPLQFHLLALTYFFLGDDDFTSRLPAAAFSAATVAFVLLAYRRYLGPAGAIAAGGLFAISPYLLFYGRYVRNEAFVAFFGVVMLWSLLRYLEAGHNRDLCLLAVVTGLHFATKETAYFYTAQALIFLAGLLSTQVIASSRGRPHSLRAWLAWLRSRPEADLLLLLGACVLPLGTPLVMRLFGWNALDLSTPGMLRTALCLVGLFAVSTVIGAAWFGQRWPRFALLFFGPQILLFTTLLTNPSGVATGLTGSLAYWLSQQAVNRGEQPIYYYALLQIPFYEFLSAGGTVLAAVLWRRLKPAPEAGFEPCRGEDNLPAPVVPLLVFWALSALALYSRAGEKMPWLTVHIALPMLLASGWAAGQLLERVDWALARRVQAWRLPIAATLGCIGLAAALSNGAALPKANPTGLLGLALGLVVTGGGGYLLLDLARRTPRSQSAALAGLLLAACLALITVRTTWRAAFTNADNAKEYLVYAHAAHDPKDALAEIERISRQTTGGLDLVVAYDNETRYPYWWYLRQYPRRIDYDQAPTRNLRDAAVILVGEPNYAKVEPIAGNAYQMTEYTRLWWPNEGYNPLKWQAVAATPGASKLSVLTDQLSVLWNSVRPLLVEPAGHKALWDLWWNRDYTGYAQVTQAGDSLTLAQWEPAERMRVYIRKDVLAQLNGQDPPVLDFADPYAANLQPIGTHHVIGSPGSQPGQLLAPRGVAVAPDGSLYVADTGNHRIQHFSAEGKLLQQWGTFRDAAQGEAPGGTFNQPWGVAVGPDGSVYVADTWNHRVQQFTADGEFLRMWSTFWNGSQLESFWGPRAATVDPAGRVYVTDTGNKRVVVFDAQGSFIATFGEEGSAPGQFAEPVGIAVSADGRIYVADTWNQRIQVFTASANGKTYALLNAWSFAGWYGQSLENKPYLAVDSAGNVYASDPEGYRIVKFSAEGAFLQAWDGLNDPQGIRRSYSGLAIDPQGGLWAVDTANGVLLGP